jgi:hypothetical protein
MVACVLGTRASGTARASGTSGTVRASGTTHVGPRGAVPRRAVPRDRVRVGFDRPTWVLPSVEMIEMLRNVVRPAIGPPLTVHEPPPSLATNSTSRPSRKYRDDYSASRHLP